jgi:hypothetical protein
LKIGVRRIGPLADSECGVFQGNQAVRLWQISSLGASSVSLW